MSHLIHFNFIFLIKTLPTHLSLCSKVNLTMEIGTEDEIADMSMSPPSMESMQIAGGNSFGPNIEFMSQAYLRNMYSEIDIEEDTLEWNKDRPLPVFLKVSIKLI